jgi:hypothetical protein
MRGVATSMLSGQDNQLEVESRMEAVADIIQAVR